MDYQNNIELKKANVTLYLILAVLVIMLVAASVGSFIVWKEISETKAKFDKFIEKPVNIDINTRKGIRLPF